MKIELTDREANCLIRTLTFELRSAERELIMRKDRVPKEQMRARRDTLHGIRKKIFHSRYVEAKGEKE